MKNKFGFLAIVLIIIALSMIFVYLFSPGDNRIDLSYDFNSDSVVIYSDILSFPSSPTKQSCLNRYFPTLRIWGDGLVFLNASATRKGQPEYWSGSVSPIRISYILEYLAIQGFFGGWTSEGPNTSGTLLHLGARLRTRSIEYSTGNLEPRLYVQLINLIMPSLQPLDQEKVSDNRILSILADIQSCTR